jgi:hypothetical protein
MLFILYWSRGVRIRLYESSSIFNLQNLSDLLFYVQCMLAAAIVAKAQHRSTKPRAARVEFFLLLNRRDCRAGGASQQKASIFLGLIIEIILLFVLS